MAAKTSTTYGDGNLSSFGIARTTIRGTPLSAEEIRKTHAFWRACNYLELGMLYLRDNPLLREPLKPEHIKSRLLGHWGSSPGLSFIYTHLNRVIKKHDLDMIFMAGPGHWRSRRARSGLSGGQLFGNLSRQIQREGAAVRILVIQTDEEREIAEQTVRTIEKAKGIQGMTPCTL